jgi:hypothetical protein
VNAGPEPRDLICDQRLEALAIFLAEEDGLAPIATKHDVVVRQ